MDNRQTLNDVFDIVPSPSVTQNYTVSTPSVIPLDQSNLDNKLDGIEKKVIENFSGLIDSGNEAIKSLSSIAESTESARDFEVLANMIKSVADINLQVIDTVEKIERIKNKRDQQKSGGQNQGGNTINQTAVFVGTTKELNAILNNMNGSGTIDHE